jgi:hypothetical protein
MIYFLITVVLYAMQRREILRFGGNEGRNDGPILRRRRERSGSGGG